MVDGRRGLGGWSGHLPLWLAICGIARRCLCNLRDGLNPYRLEPFALPLAGLCPSVDDDRRSDWYCGCRVPRFVRRLCHDHRIFRRVPDADSERGDLESLGASRDGVARFQSSADVGCVERCHVLSVMFSEELSGARRSMTGSGPSVVRGHSGELDAKRVADSGRESFMAWYLDRAWSAVALAHGAHIHRPSKRGAVLHFAQTPALSAFAYHVALEPLSLGTRFDFALPRKTGSLFPTPYSVLHVFESLIPRRIFHCRNFTSIIRHDSARNAQL